MSVIVLTQIIQILTYLILIKYKNKLLLNIEISTIISKLYSKIEIMKKIFIHSFIGIFCFTIVMSCGKDVKAPAGKPADAAKTSANSPVTQTSGQDQNNHTCGSQSGSSGSSNSSGTYGSGY